MPLTTICHYKGFCGSKWSFRDNTMSGNGLVNLVSLFENSDFLMVTRSEMALGVEKTR